MQKPIDQLDESSIFGLCNSLSACIPPMREVGFQTVANHMFRAQCTITRLYEENKHLKQMIESTERKMGEDNARTD